MADAIVVMPSIPQRREDRTHTISQWGALGYEVLVTEQDPDLPLCHASQTATAQAALRAGVERGTAWVIYSEDDINIDLAYAIAHLNWCFMPHMVVALGARDRFYPAPIKIEILGPDPMGFDIHPVADQKHWFSAFALTMPTSLAERLAQWKTGGDGIDLRLRDMAEAPDVWLSAVAPAMVQHRHLRRHASGNQAWVGYQTYGRWDGR